MRTSSSLSPTHTSRLCLRLMVLIRDIFATETAGTSPIGLHLLLHLLPLPNNICKETCERLVEDFGQWLVLFSTLLGIHGISWWNYGISWWNYAGNGGPPN